MGPIATKTKGKPKKNLAHARLEEAINRIAESQNSGNEQVLREMQQMRSDIQEMKDTLSRIQVKKPFRPRGGFLFGRRRSTPVEIEPPKPKSALPLEDLLPLLPQLGGVIPQLKNPKVSESIKVLSNPAVIAMIQQFLANGGLGGLGGFGLKGKGITPVSRRERRIWR
ncbi:hypothetical protein NDK47_03040 [Brevibacillus ruminantium]|uniref:Uncharacterized protein n=1 Tax=Brevibacillus ruminantium TaxID=2950604 RepID=A0ABY4WHI2_9BACL|nr:hypothetical protein [Brevibacillus ruminantium]USG66324.1 hypothetical protein NDK47_03040 [Brevibacillus ruminantium]